MSLPFAVSTSRFSSSSSIPFIRSDDSRIFLRPGLVISHAPTHTPSRRPYFNRPSWFTPFRPRQFTTTFCTYSENPTHASHFLTHKSPDHIYPLQSKLEECGPLREKFLPLFGCLSRGCLWLGPIDRVCVPPVLHLWCITRGGSWTCTVFLVHLRFSSPSVSQGRHSPSRPTFLIKWTTLFHTFCYADFVAALFSGS